MATVSAGAPSVGLGSVGAERPRQQPKFADAAPGVIRIEDMSGQPRAIVMNYACHADVVCLSYAISADFPGAAARKVEEAFPDAYCLFVNGAAGGGGGS